MNNLLTLFIRLKAYYKRLIGKRIRFFCTFAPKKANATASGVSWQYERRVVLVFFVLL